MRVTMEQFVPICENREFRRIYARGASYVGRTLVVYVMKGRHKEVRIGITVGKKVGNAVKRNRARRVIRESFRAIAPFVKPGNDFVFVARTKSAYVKSTEVLREMEKQLKKAGVLQ